MRKIELTQKNVEEVLLNHFNMDGNVEFKHDGSFVITGEKIESPKEDYKAMFGNSDNKEVLDKRLSELSNKIKDCEDKINELNQNEIVKELIAKMNEQSELMEQFAVSYNYKQALE